MSLLTGMPWSSFTGTSTVTCLHIISPSTALLHVDNPQQHWCPWTDPGGLDSTHTAVTVMPYHHEHRSPPKNHALMHAATDPLH